MLHMVRYQFLHYITLDCQALIAEQDIVHVVIMGTSTITRDFNCNVGITIYSKFIAFVCGTSTFKSRLYAYGSFRQDILYSLSSLRATNFSCVLL